MASSKTHRWFRQTVHRPRRSHRSMLESLHLLDEDQVLLCDCETGGGACADHDVHPPTEAASARRVA